MAHSHYRGPLVYDTFPSYADFSPPIHEAAIRPRTQSSRTFGFADQQRPWSDTGNREGHHGKRLMSHRTGQDPSGSTTRNDSSAASPTTSPRPSQPGHRASVGTRNVTSPTSQRHPQSTASSYELPPLQQATGAGFLPSAARVAGVSSILNPSQAEETPQSRRRKASQLESPASSVQSLPPIVTSVQAPQTTSILPAPSPVTQYAALGDRQPRRILTPRSPSLHRAASLGQLNPSAGTISAQRTPFPTSPRTRTYTIEPGTSGAPPLPTPPAVSRPLYGFPNTTTPPVEAARRVSTGVPRGRQLSSSASPSTSYSSYSQAGHNSPATHYPSTSFTTVPNLYSTGGDGPFAGLNTPSALPGTTGVERQRPIGIPISSSGGQNVYQMMTLETTSGTVQLPVDVQAASRVADEKRRRNAGASARFRQRRKEKEKEASTTISRMEQQMKELGEEVDFYRRERDFLAGILTHIPGGERHFPRPASPRQRRSSIASLSGPSGPGARGFTPGQEQARRSPDEGRNVRRRTSTFSLPPPQPQPQLPPPGTTYQSSYGAQAYGGPLASQTASGTQQSRPGPLPSPIGRGSLPSPSQLTSQLALGQRPQQEPPGPPQVLQPTPQTGPWNPYPSERRPPGPPSQTRDSR